MMPLLVEGTQLKYVPWGGRDVETLKSKQPSLRDGLPLLRMRQWEI